MSSIRPLTPDDLQQVADLYGGVMRSLGSPPGLDDYFERILLRHPWADDDLPSLVFEGPDGKILGFIGAHVRRLRFDGARLRLVCAGQLVSDPAARRRGVGALLLRDLLSGEQDMTITDGGTPTVAEIWGRLRDEPASLRSVGWTRLFRPTRAVGNRLMARAGRESWVPAAGRVFGLLDRMAERRFRPERPDGVSASEELTAAALLEHLPAVTEGLRLHVDYDSAYLEWLFEEMAAVRSRGPLVKRLVRRGEAVIGWYVAYLPPDGVGQAMQLAAVPRSIDAVLDRLLYDASEAGVAALQGRLEPALFEPLARRRCLLRAGERALVHSRDPSVRGSVETGKALLTRMDGEWWMGHHLADGGVTSVASPRGGGGRT